VRLELSWIACEPFWVLIPDDRVSTVDKEENAEVQLSEMREFDPDWPASVVAISLNGLPSLPHAV
jgi:hypothetical protein